MLSVALACGSTARGQASDRLVTVKFVVDGEVQQCYYTKIKLHIGRQLIRPKIIKDGFVAPAVFERLYAHDQTRRTANIAADITCRDRTLAFDGLYPSWVKPGLWTVGVANPISWPGNWSYATQTGVWSSYLVSECNGCDPGVVTVQAQTEIPQAALSRLVVEQPHATDARARDIAFALAVWKYDATGNTNFLKGLFAKCLRKSESDPDDDVCDDGLLHELANLYWRGDDNLLPVLLRSAESKSQTASEGIGYFSGDLLERRTVVALTALKDLGPDAQRAVCRIAGEDDFRINSPKTERVQEQLREVGGEVAERCMAEIKQATAP
jgi:hypothetical protein